MTRKLVPFARTRFLLSRGLFVFLPAATAIFVVRWCFVAADNVLGKTLYRFMPHRFYGLGLFVLLVLLLLIGLVSMSRGGRKLILAAEGLFTRIPAVGFIYGTTLRILHVAAANQQAAFGKPVLVQYPVPGSWSLGFVTSEDIAAEIGVRDLGRLCTVFVPTTPNPTSGLMLVIEERKIVPLNLPRERAFRMVISGGVTASIPDQGGETRTNVIDLLEAMK